MSTIRSLVVLNAALAVTCAASSATPFVANDIEICAPVAGVLDPEFDSMSQSMIYMDRQARVHVTTMQSDGTVGSAGCFGTIIDQGIWGWPGGTSGYNGPEFGRSQRGLEIYYVKPLADGQTPALARAWGNGGGWQNEYLVNGDRRSVVVPSRDATDLQPRLTYLYRPRPDAASVPAWRESADPSTESIFPGAYVQSTGGSPRWIPGQRALSLTHLDAAGTRQAARYFIDTRVFETLTNDAGNKDEVWIWSAPEFAGEMALITVVDGCCLRVYRQTGTTWNHINTISAPAFSGLSSIFSPEPLVFRGRSYVALQVGNHLMDASSQIWVTSIDPAAPLLRQISEAKTGVIRTEPEWFVTPEGALVYYSAQVLGGKSLRRATTGLR